MDLAVAEFFFGLVGRWGWIDGLVIFLAKFLPFLVGAAFIFFFFQVKPWTQRLYFGLFSLLAVILSRGIFAEIIHFFFFRSRPFEALGLEGLLKVEGPAFPSAHASFLFALAFVLWLFNRRWGWAFIIASLINGLARIASGVHWVTDVAAGFLVALLAVFLTNLLLRNLSPAARPEKLAENSVSPEKPF